MAPLAYSNAHLANDVDTRQSVNGCMMNMTDGPVTWVSYKQMCFEFNCWD